jgi:ketosteroid isomerase-like protein
MPSIEPLPDATPHSDARVERASLESFPASDPPPFSRQRPRQDGPGQPRANDRRFAALHASPWTHRWVASFIDALEAHDADAIGALLTEDVIVRWDVSPLVVGRPAAVAHLVPWFAAQRPADQHVTDVRGDDEAVFIEIDMQRATDREPESWPVAISARLRAGGASRLTRYGGPR